MSPSKIIEQFLRDQASPQHCLLSSTDLRCLVPSITDIAFKSVLFRLCQQGVLQRMVKGIFYYPHCRGAKGHLLYHVAAKQREQHFNYLSLESVLSQAGLISQLPMNWISIMTSGRSYTQKIPSLGTIEFIHTHQTPEKISQYLHHDSQLKMWVASPELALMDMKHTKRNMDLIDESFLKLDHN